MKKGIATLALTALVLTGCAGMLQVGYVYPPDIPNWEDYESIRHKFGLPDDRNVVGLVVVYSPEYESIGSICNDGSYSSSVGQGTCSWHGGVQSTSSWSTGPRYLVKYLLGTDGSCVEQRQFSLEVLKERNKGFFCKKGDQGLSRRFKQDTVQLMDLVGWKTYLYKGSDTQVLQNRL